MLPAERGYYRMLFRSTGLGKTELVAKVVDIKRQGDYLIMYVDSTEPVRWHIRAALSLKDVTTVLKVIVKFSILKLLLSPINWRKEPQHPGDY